MTVLQTSTGTYHINETYEEARDRWVAGLRAGEDSLVEFNQRPRHQSFGNIPLSLKASTITAVESE